MCRCGRACRSSRLIPPPFLTASRRTTTSHGARHVWLSATRPYSSGRFSIPDGTRHRGAARARTGALAQAPVAVTEMAVIAGIWNVDHDLCPRDDDPALRVRAWRSGVVEGYIGWTFTGGYAEGAHRLGASTGGRTDRTACRQECSRHRPRDSYAAVKDSVCEGRNSMSVTFCQLRSAVSTHHDDHRDDDRDDGDPGYGVARAPHRLLGGIPVGADRVARSVSAAVHGRQPAKV